MAENSQKYVKQSKNIKVFIRIRPFSESEVNSAQCVYPVDANQIIMREKESGLQPPAFHFDRIFTPDSPQTEIFRVVADNIIDNAFKGINGTIFCYGQTSSGKTYTCIGPEYPEPSKRGILPRTIEEIQKRIRLAPKNMECKMKISMIEIYNEKIRDLLDQTKIDLKIRSNKSQGIFLEHVTEKYVLSDEQSCFYISKGIENRSVSFTNMNSLSSRSHMVVIITIHQHDFYSGEARIAKITLVDLAGSEKISRSGAEGRVLEQAKKINTSLSTLGKVINNLSQGKKAHVPYRDSKLTRLLQQSLGGNSITSLIINVSPAVINEQESLSSLRFGFRAKSIKNEPKVNKQYTVPELLQLLTKSDNKVRELIEIVKQLAKEKGFTSTCPEELMKHYNIKNIQTVSAFDVDSDDDRNSIRSSNPSKYGNTLAVSGSQPSLFQFHSGINSKHQNSQVSSPRLSYENSQKLNYENSQNQNIMSVGSIHIPHILVEGENRKKSTQQNKFDETPRQNSKANNSANLLHLNKSVDFPAKKFLIPKPHDYSKKGKCYSKKSEKQKKANFGDDKDKPVREEQEVNLNDLVIRVNFDGQGPGKSEKGKSQPENKFSLQSKIYDLRLIAQKNYHDHLDLDQHQQQPSKDTGTRSQSSDGERQRKQKLIKQEDQEPLGRSLEENLQQIKRNLEKMRRIKKTKKNPRY